jgi:hypothetical protein
MMEGRMRLLGACGVSVQVGRIDPGMHVVVVWSEDELWKRARETRQRRDNGGGAEGTRVGGGNSLGMSVHQSYQITPTHHGFHRFTPAQPLPLWLSLDSTTLRHHTPPSISLHSELFQPSTQLVCWSQPSHPPHPRGRNPRLHLSSHPHPPRPAMSSSGQGSPNIPTAGSSRPILPGQPPQRKDSYPVHTPSALSHVSSPGAGTSGATKRPLAPAPGGDARPERKPTDRPQSITDPISGKKKRVSLSCAQCAYPCATLPRIARIPIAPSIR